MNPEPSKSAVKNFWIGLKQNLRNSFRVVVMREDNLEEKTSFVLTPLNALVFSGALVLLLIIAVIYLIAFTSLREYIPGYADVGLRRMVINVSERADSLEKTISDREKYLANLNVILSGKTISENIKPLKKDSTGSKSGIKDFRSTDDSILRVQIEQEEQSSIQSGTLRESTGINSLFFYVPVQGKNTSRFDAAEGHFGVDVAGHSNEPVKSTLDGTVVLTGWSPENGHFIQIQHQENLISVYKHNSALLRKTGERVKAGEPIAIIGSSGEHSTGPHLHFELWYKGVAINPSKYMRI